MKKILILASFILLLFGGSAVGQTWYGVQYFPDYLLVGEDSIDLVNDVVLGDDYLFYKSDTTTKWSWTVPSGDLLVSGSKLFAWKYEGDDTLYITKAVVISYSAAPNFSYNVYWATDYSGSGTAMFSSAPVVTGSDATSTGEVDTPNTNSIPPNVIIWLYIDDDTAIPTSGAGFSFIGKEY